MDLLTGDSADPYGDFEKQDYDDRYNDNNTQSDPNKNNQSSSKPQSRSMMPKFNRSQIAQMKQMQATKLVTNMVNKMISKKENDIDDQYNKLNKKTKGELEELREKRLDQLKRKADQRERWLSQSHGSMISIKDDKEFFSIVKSSKFVICLFYSRNNKFCTMLQEHLTLLARQHMECKFTQIEAEHAPFLIENLGLWMMPTIVLAKNYKVDRKLIGLDWVSPNGKLETETLEQKLFEYGFLEETYLGIKKQIESVSKYVKNKREESDDEDDLDL